MEELTQEENLEESTQEVEETKDELDAREIEMAKKYGIIQEEPTQEEPTQEENLEESTQEVEEIKDENFDIKEKINKGENLTEEEEKKVHEWSADEKAMYWKWKGEKQKRQVVQKERELIEIKSKAKDQRIKELEELEEKYKSGNYELEDENDFITREEAIKIAEQKLENQNVVGNNLQQVENNYKASIAEQLSIQEKMKNSTFEQIEKKFKELVENDTEIATEAINRYNRLGTNEYAGDDLINFVYRSVERSGFKIDNKSNKQQQEKTDRIIKNSTKPLSTASLGAAEGHSKTLEEYQLNDFLEMSDKEYQNLSREKQEFLMRKFG
jgi:hypothetical protein